MGDVEELAIRVRGLVKTYGGRAVVDHLDLDVRPGEVFGVLGPNGAGKSTTVDILTGARPRTAGEVSVLGADPRDDGRAWRARLGVVPQATGQFYETTVREIVGQFASFYADPLPIDQVLDMVGLGAKSKAFTESLSGGQKRRLDVAIGVVGDPDLIFLDEPTTGLDPVARREAWDLIRFFADRGTTTVLTTHYLDEVEALAARAAIIVKGSVVECGPVAELGGRGTATSLVRFRPPERLTGIPLPDLGAHRVERDSAGDITIRTLEPAQVAYTVLGWARDNGVPELPGFRVVQPTLEDIYLDLVKQHGDPADLAGAA